MLMRRQQLSVIVKKFLSEVSDDEAQSKEKKSKPSLSPITIIQDDVKVELKKEGEKFKVYVNGNEVSNIEPLKISAIIAKAHKEVAQKIADGDEPEAAENILNWADTLLKGKRAALQSTSKHRLSVLWNSWMEVLTKRH